MITFIGAAGVTIVLAVITWLLVRSRDRQRRMNALLDDLNLRLTTLPGAKPLPEQEAAAAPASERDVVLDGLKGDRAPGFSLPDLDGNPVSLTSLREAGKPVLLFFSDPRCGPCYELLPDIGGWQRVYGDHLTIAVISGGDVATNRTLAAEYDLDRVLLQHDMDVVLAYNLAQAPAAVLIDIDGMVTAGPRYGANAARKLMAETLGVVMPPIPIRAIETIGKGGMVSALRLPDLGGSLVDLRVYRGEPVVVLFWNPGCGFCQQLLPDALAFEHLANRPNLVIVSRGPHALNADLGFRSPVVVDESRTFGQSLGVTGTPAAIAIDHTGRIVTTVASGVDQVRMLMASAAMAMRPGAAEPIVSDDSSQAIA